MKLSKIQITKEINNLTKKNKPNSWYIGITNDIDRRISEHELKLKFNIKLYHFWQCYSTDVAKEIEIHFLKQGFQGNSGGNSDNSVYVYIFYLGNDKY